MKRVSQIWTCLLCGFNSVVHKRGEKISWNFYVILLFLQASLHPGNKIHLFSHVSPPPYAMVPNCVTVRHCGICSDEKEKLWRHTVEILLIAVYRTAVRAVTAVGLLHRQQHVEANAVKYLRFTWRWVCALLCSGLWYPERWISTFWTITLLQRRWYPVTGRKQHQNYRVQMYILVSSGPL